MFVLIVIKAITLVLISLKYFTLKMGLPSEGWAISFYVFTLYVTFFSFLRKMESSFPSTLLA